MRYVLVNDRRPKGLPRFCAYNVFHVIGDYYCRELVDNILYCSAVCYESHVHDSLVKIGGLDAVSKLCSPPRLALPSPPVV